jgi:hypothetical protein
MQRTSRDGQVRTGGKGSDNGREKKKACSLFDSPKTKPKAIRTVQSSLRTTRRSTAGSISKMGAGDESTASTAASPLKLDFSSAAELILSESWTTKPVARS